MMKLRWLTVAVVVVAACALAVRFAAGQVFPAGGGNPAAGGITRSAGAGRFSQGDAEEGAPARLKFNNAPLQMLLDEYAKQTGRTLLMAPNLPDARITLRSQTDLSQQEYLEAIEKVLGMNGIALLREGDRFFRVVPNTEARREPMDVRPYDPSSKEPPPDPGQLISQMVPLKHIEFEDAMKALEPLKHQYGQIHYFDGTKTMLITDSAATVGRLMEILKFIDQPVEAREEPIIVEILNAKAADIKAKLEEIIADSDAQAGKATVQRQRLSGAPGVERSTSPGVPLGVIRAVQPSTPADSAAAASAAEKGLIQGRVKIVEDERTNKLIIITRPENMVFFQKIIKVLDVPTTPDIIVRVYRLEYAEAKDVGDMLNELIGAAVSEKDAKPGDVKKSEGAQAGEGTALREYVQRITQPQAQAGGRAAQPAGKSKIGELSKDNIKILSDDRTNSLLIMASRSDLATLEEIIKGMDTMLSQVLVEAVILEINLDNNIESSADWIQRALVTYEKNTDGSRKAISAQASSGGGGRFNPVDPTDLTTPGSFPKGASGAPLSGLTYYLTLFDLNMDAVFHLAASDSRTRILSSPVILTTDNKEASIDVTQSQYFYKGKRPVSSGTTGTVLYEDDVEQKDIGITLKVTPRINEKRFVVMEIEQKIQNVSGEQEIGGNKWPIVTTRTFDADVAVHSGDSIVLGGLVINEDRNSETKIPFIGDIPILGRLFKSSSKGKARREVVVFLTPYVLDTPVEMEVEAKRRQGALRAEGMWKKGWSGSRLAEPASDRQWRKPDRPADAEREPEARKTPKPPREGVETGETIDPELRRFIDQENERWEKSLEKIDKRTDQGRRAEDRKDTLF